MRMVRTADSRPILGMYTVYAGAEAAKDTEVQRRRVSQQFVVEVEHVTRRRTCLARVTAAAPCGLTPG